jgi:DNA-binding PucR family transcriptional regulator
VYAVLPGVVGDGVPPALRAMCREVTAIVQRRSGSAVRAGIGSGVAGLAGVPASRADADRVLDAMTPDAADPDGSVAAIGDLRAEILLDETLARLGDLHDPAAAALLDHDAEHGSDLAPSVLTYLDTLGDVRAAAARLTVHPNTLRYRLRRASEVAGLRLDDPSARLVHHLHLLRAARAATGPTPHAGPRRAGATPTPTAPAGR